MQRLVVSPSQITAPLIHLSAEQQHYLHRVLRLQGGDRFIAMNGQGESWLARLVEPASGQLQAEILEAIAAHTELPIAVTLVMALPKGNGFDDVVRQVTELGVSSIVPVISDRTLLHPSPQKLDRWQRIAQEAAEQSERQIVPTIAVPISFQHHLASLSQPSFKQTSDVSQLSLNYLCVTRYTAPHLLNCLVASRAATSQQLVANSCQLTAISHQPLVISITIGPEGGWTDQEVKQAIAAGYQPVSLGSRILRSVTAPITALSLIAAVYE